MAFHHFHKHKQKYLVISAAAMIFTMVTFSIPSALQAFTGSSSGDAQTVWVKFRTSGESTEAIAQASGEEVEILLGEWERLRREVSGLASLMPMSYYGSLGPAYAPMAHAILLAEAKAVGIQVTPEQVQRSFDSLVGYYMQMDPDGKLTKKELAALFARGGLSEEAFRQRLEEYLRIQFFMGCVEPISIIDPGDVLRFFQARHTQVQLEYVEFPYDQFAQALAEVTPDDEVLQAFYDDMDPWDKGEEFYHPETFSLDMAVVDYDAIDLAAHADALADFVPPGDEEVVRAYKGDPTRYGEPEEGASVETLADVPQEAQDRIVRDEKIRHLMMGARDEYQREVARLEMDEAAPEEADSTDDGGAEDTGDGGSGDDGRGAPQDGGADDGATEDSTEQDGGAEDSTDQESGDGADDEAAAAAEKARLEQEAAEKDAQQREIFHRIVVARGLAVQRHEDLSRDEVVALDPPDDPDLQFTLGLLRVPGDVQVVEAARDRRYGYTMRLARKVPSTLKTLDEARDQLIDLWREKEAGKQAKEAARAFRDAVREQALAAVTDESAAATEAERKAARVRKAGLESLQAAYAAERAAIEEGDGLDDTFREQRLENLRSQWFVKFSALVGAVESQPFAQRAEASGLERRTLGPFARSISSHPYFRETHEGAERFLMAQNAQPFGAALLGSAVGVVSDVLEDREGKAVYVARMANRQLPGLGQMTVQQRLRVEDECRSWQQRKLGIDYYNPFSARLLLEFYRPQIRRPPPSEEAETASS